MDFQNFNLMGITDTTETGNNYVCTDTFRVTVIKYNNCTTFDI